MLTGWAALFGSAFLAATLLPGSSEAIMLALMHQGGEPVGLVLVATVGNTLGAVVNWALGLFLLRFRDRRWFYFNEQQIQRAQRAFQRYGVWTLVLSWLPVVGDALTLVAGVMRVRLWLFLALVATGKGARYGVLAYAYLGVSSGG